MTSLRGWPQQRYVPSEPRYSDGLNSYGDTLADAGAHGGERMPLPPELQLQAKLP